eukprot:1325645-Rhodomonas_salina.1
MSVEIPNGRIPPLCVYFCWIPAMCLRPRTHVSANRDALSSQLPLLTLPHPLTSPPHTLPPPSRSLAPSLKPSLTPSPLARESHVPGDVFNGDGVLHGEAERLALDARAVHKHARVGGEACRSHKRQHCRHKSERCVQGRRQTRERQAHVVVQHVDLPHSPRLLQLGSGFLLDAQHNHVVACPVPL